MLITRSISYLMRHISTASGACWRRIDRVDFTKGAREDDHEYENGNVQRVLPLYRERRGGE